MTTLLLNRSEMATPSAPSRPLAMSPTPGAMKPSGTATLARLAALMMVMSWLKFLLPNVLVGLLVYPWHLGKGGGVRINSLSNLPPGPR